MSFVKLCPAMEGIGGLRISSVHINWDGMYEFLWLLLYEVDGSELRWETMEVYDRSLEMISIYQQYDHYQLDVPR